MSITTRPWNGCGPKPPVASLTERFPTVHFESDGPLQHVSLRRCICCLRSNVRTSVPLGQVCISEMSRVAKGWTTNADQTRCRRLLVTLPPSREGVAPEGTSQRLYPRSPFLSKDDGLPPRNRWRCWRARCSSEMQVEKNDDFRQDRRSSRSSWPEAPAAQRRQGPYAHVGAGGGQRLLRQAVSEPMKPVLG
jgi:hypothetical protein